MFSLPKVALLSPSAFSLEEKRRYSVGIHPWWTADDTELLWAGVQQIAPQAPIVMIGEVGFDTLQGDFQRQRKEFERHVQLSESLHKPLVIHCVRAFHELLQAHKRYRPTQVWTVHGFRGKPALAAQLLSAGLHLSFGLHFHPESLRLCPIGRLRIETDDSAHSLESIFAKHQAIRPSLTPEDTQTDLPFTFP